MAAIPTILKGDDSGSIIITMATGRTYTGATLIVAYQGVTKTFTNLTPGGAVNLVYSHDETAKMAVKTAPVLMRLVGPTGGEETVENAEARIRVTDCLAEVNAGGSFSVAPHTGTVDPTKVPITDVGDMSARYSLADLKAKVDQIVRVLAQRSLLSLGAALCAASVFGASSSSARLDALYNDSTVVTNVSFAGLLTSESDPKWTSDKPNFLTATNAAATYQPKGNYITSESDPTVPAWAKAANPPESGKIDKIYTNGVEAVAVNKNVYLTIPEGGGGAPSDYTTTNAVKSIVNAEVGGTNTLVHSGAISDMATKTWVGEQAYWKNGQFASWGTSARGTISLSSGPSGTTFEAHGQNASASFSGDSKIYIDLATVDILYPNMVNIGTKDLPTYVGDIAESKVPANIVTYTAGSPSTSSAILSSANATAESKLTTVGVDTFSTTNHDSIAYKAAAVVADQQWSSPGAWTASYVMIPSTEDHSGANSYTNWNWMIYSNFVASITYGYTAKCYQEVLDLITANASPIVRWEAFNGGSFSNDYFSVTNSGMYRVRAHAADGTVDSMDIPMFPQKKESKTQDIYIADATNGWRKSVNDTAKTLLLAATTNGTGTIEGKTYNKFITFTAPFAPTGSGRLYPWIVSPHVVASAWHYGGSVARGWYTLSYNGQTSTVYRLNWYKLDQWALTHGWSQEEVNAMNISDIYLCQCNNGAFPSEWCPKFMSDAKRTEYFAGDMKCVQGWSVNQDSPYAIPLTFDSNTRWQPVKTSASIISRADIKPILEAMAPCAWGYGGDSGKPIFIKHGADFVIISAFCSAISGPDYSKGFEVLKAFCAFCGDTIKEVE